LTSTAVPVIYTLSLHDALPIWSAAGHHLQGLRPGCDHQQRGRGRPEPHAAGLCRAACGHAGRVRHREPGHLAQRRRGDQVPVRGAAARGRRLLLMTGGRPVQARILAMLPDYPPSGVGSWVMTHTLLSALAARGHRVDVVLACRRGAPYELDGVHVWSHRGKSDPLRFVRDAHVIVTHVDLTQRAVLIGHRYDKPVVQIAHNTSPLSRAALQRWPATLTVFNSSHAAAAMGDVCDRWIVVRPPVRMDDYATTP